MKGKQQSKLLLVLFLCTAYIFAFSHFGTKAYESFASENDVFSEGTMIGPIDISGKSKVEASDLVTTQVNSWLANDSIDLHFREKTLAFDKTNIHFNISDSTELAIDGQSNPLLVEINKEEVQKTIVLIAPSYTVTDELEIALLEKAQSLSDDINLKVDDYLSVTPKMEILSTVNVEIDPMLLEGVILEKISIPAQSAFSFASFIEQKKLVSTPADTLNILSSSIYQLILPTNFPIQERHIGTVLSENISLGFEAKIDSNLGWDFAFLNPNNYEFLIQFTKENGTLKLELLGYPFVNSYQYETLNEQTFEPKTIKRYDPILMPDETQEEFAGKDGSYIEVYRKVFTPNGEWINTELLSKDFYPPQHRVELVGLKSTVVEIPSVDDSFPEDWLNPDENLEEPNTSEGEEQAEQTEEVPVEDSPEEEELPEVETTD